MIGGERIGLVAAEYLASWGKQVTLVEMGKRLASDVMATFKWRHAAWVKEFQIETLLNTEAKEITGMECWWRKQARKGCCLPIR